MLRSAVLILSGNAAASLLLLARNLIIARLIPVADYGIASTFAIAMAVVEMMSALGLQQQIVQAKEGDDPRFQAALQGFQLVRGVLASLVLLALARPIAGFMGVSEAAWAYQVMAAVPILNALVHFDIYRMNRSMVFWPMALTGAVPALASVLVVWPLSHWFGDYRVMLYALLTQAGLTAVTSHLVATRSWRLVLDRTLMAGSLRFGWPLLVNGILMFAVFNGDKLIVGRALGMEALAIFAMGFGLTLTPTLVMAKSAQNFFLPQLSATAQDGPRFQHLALVTLQSGLLNGAVLVLAVVLAGVPVVHLLLGAKYADLLPLLVPLAILQAMRVFKTGGAVVALARGQTGNAMLANLPRVAALPLAWLVLMQGGGLAAVIWVATAGETLGLVVSIWLVVQRLHLPMRPMLLPLLTTVGFIVAAALPALPDLGLPELALPGWGQPALVLTLFLVLLASLRECHRYLARTRDIP